MTKDDNDSAFQLCYTVHINTCSGPDPKHFDTNVTREDCEIALKLDLQKNFKHNVNMLWDLLFFRPELSQNLAEVSCTKDVKNEVAHILWIVHVLERSEADVFSSCAGVKNPIRRKMIKKKRIKVDRETCRTCKQCCGTGAGTGTAGTVQF